MLNKLCVSNGSGNFTVVSSVRFIVLYVGVLYVLYIYIYIYVSYLCAAQHPQGTTFNMSTTAQRGHVAYSSWLSWEQKSHLLLLYLGTIDCELFPRVVTTMTSK